jgi:hypothetical protein
MTIVFSGSPVANVQLSDSFNTWRLTTNKLLADAASLTSNNTFAGANTNFSGEVRATTFIGDGSNLTNAGSTVATDSANHDLLVPFTGISSGTMTSANVNASFTFNPSTGTLSATAFSGDGSNLTNAGSTVASDTSANRNLFVAFTGVTSGTMTSANVNSTFTFNPGSGRLNANSVQSGAFVDGSGRTLIIRNSSNTVVWGE